MKKNISILLFLACLCTFSGCSGGTEKDDRISVVCTIFPQYDIVRQIAGDLVSLKMLLPFGMESHDLRLENFSARDIKTISDADIFIYVGGESDRTWVGEIKSFVQKNNVEWLSLCDMTETLCSDEHHNHEHIDEHIDEHVWTSPERMLEITDSILEALKNADPKNSEKFVSGAEKFKKELLELDNGFKALNGMNGETLIFADRFPFRYLFEDYSMKYMAAFEGCGSAVDPSALQISEICKTAKKQGTKTVFCIENSNESYVKTIAGTVNANYQKLHSCHNVTRTEYLNGETYITLMKKNLEILTEAMG